VLNTSPSAMRTAFIEELTAQARVNPRIFLVVGDLGFSVVEKFATEFPDRFLNAGVAEQNMTGVAAGLASEGYQVFTYSIANFPTTRCLEQIRNDICYHRLPVTVVAVGGGVAYGNLGYSHHAVQDYAMLRGFPGICVYSPGDPMEVRGAVRAISACPGPGYLRLGKNGEPCQHPAVPSLPARLPAILHVAGPLDARNAILTTGAPLDVAVKAVAQVEDEIWSVWSMPCWGEASGEAVHGFVARHNKVIAVEEHLAAGGFGSFLREGLGNAGDLQARLFCANLVPSVCDLVGKQQTLYAAGGIDIHGLISGMRRSNL